MLLPSAGDAAAWFVETARAAVRSGARLDADAVQLLMSLAPDDPVVPVAIDRLASDPRPAGASEPGTGNPERGTGNPERGTGNPEHGTRNPERGTDVSLAEVARHATARLRDVVAAGDEAAARETVTALETEVLRVYRPARGLGRFEDDVAVALAMLAAYDVGDDQTHLMMAEELMLGVVRRDWTSRADRGLAANCEAAVALAALASRTGKAEYRERAFEVMLGYAATYRELGVDAAPYVSALQAIS
ncbi:MAG: hypothetical protein ACRD26_21440 [Vicinamibacterales bacterium]